LISQFVVTICSPHSAVSRLCRVSDESGLEGRVFSFNMLALVDHLEQQSTQNRLASYFNIDTLKYRVRNSNCTSVMIVRFR